MDHQHHHGGPPPQVYHVSHGGPPPEVYPPPPPPVFNVHHPPPPLPQVYHVSHHGPGLEVYPPPPPPGVNAFAPPPHHHPRHHHDAHQVDDEVFHRPTVKMYCKAENHHCLSIRDGKVILARADPLDPFQHWIRDERFGSTVKDDEGHPGFALINKATRQAIKHSIGSTHPVQLIPYNPHFLDESILWSESKPLGDGYLAIRMVNNIRLNFDAFHGDKDHGGVHDGSIIVLWGWTKGDNQRWKIVPY